METEKRCGLVRSLKHKPAPVKYFAEVMLRLSSNALEADFALRSGYHFAYHLHGEITWYEWGYLGSGIF